MTLKVTNTAYDVTGSGDTRHVGVKAIKVDATVEGDRRDDRAEGRLPADHAPRTRPINTCEDLGEIPDLETAGIDPQQLEDLQATAKKVFSDYTNPGFTVKQVGGSWYVSPMATGFDQLFAVSKALTRDEIEELVDQVQQFIETVEENGGFDEVPALPGLPDYNRPGDDDAARRRRWSPPTRTRRRRARATDLGAAGHDASDESTRDAVLRRSRPAGGGRVLRRPRRAAATIDQSEVPWWLQHSECGATDANWAGEYYSLPDDEFVALIDKAAPCYQAARRQR